MPNYTKDLNFIFHLRIFKMRKAVQIQQAKGSVKTFVSGHELVPQKNILYKIDTIFVFDGFPFETPSTLIL